VVADASRAVPTTGAMPIRTCSTSFASTPTSLFAVTVASTAQAASLLRRNPGGLTSLTGRAVVVDADGFQIPVEVDDEALVLDTPVRCSAAGRPAGPGTP
jgi:hypothetical protein